MNFEKLIQGDENPISSFKTWIGSPEVFRRGRGRTSCMTKGRCDRTKTQKT